jgi:CHAD domain-containing protein
MARKRDIQLPAGDHAKQLAAGAAAVAGAAAAGGKLARDRRSRSARDHERAFRLHPGEPVPEGVRRIARGQLDLAHDQLEGASKRRLPDGVHDTRKSLKRLRASVRLARGALGDDVYHRENETFRDTGRRLSGVRDATVLIETLDEVVDAAGAELPKGATVDLRSRLERDREEAIDAVRSDGAVTAAVVDELDSARARTAAWTFHADGFDALDPGLRRIYRRGRKAMRRASDEATSENLHEWRKRVKDLWHALQILRPAAPKRMRKLAKRTHGLSNLLGDDHDLAELRSYAVTHPQCFGEAGQLAALTALIDRRRASLQRRAFEAGFDLYSQRPKRFAGKIGRGLDKQAHTS